MNFIPIAAGLGASLMLLAGCAMLIYFLMRKSHLKQVRRNKVMADADFPKFPSRKSWQTRDNGVEMAEMARDFSAQISTKIIVLEQLIADSEKKIERMEYLLEQIEEAKQKN